MIANAYNNIKYDTPIQKVEESAFLFFFHLNSQPFGDKEDFKYFFSFLLSDLKQFVSVVIIIIRESHAGMLYIVFPTLIQQLNSFRVYSREERCLKINVKFRLDFVTKYN